MSKNKHTWLSVGLAAIVVSGCATGSKPNLNLGIADAFNKSRNCLLKKKLTYQAPVGSTNFGYGKPACSSGNCIGTPTPISVASPEVVPHSSQPAGGDCNCDDVGYEPTTQFYMPISEESEVVAAPTEMKSVQTAPMPPAVPAALPFEASTNSNELENPLPPAVEEPEAPLLDLIPDEEEGIIQTLDSASIKTEEPEEAEEEITIKPKRDEASILETAATSLESSTPTSAGTSVMDRRTKMLTLTARPVQSHRGIQATESEQIEMRQVTHKRHFRQQNALRPLHRQFRNGPLEHTAEIPAPVKFKPLPVLPTSSSKQESVDTTTGAAAFRRTPVPQNQEQSSGTLQESSATKREADSETGAGSVIKIGRLPILKAESSPSASISSLKNFTNVRDHGARFHDDQHSRERAILATQTAEPLAEKISDAGDDLSIQR